MYTTWHTVDVNHMKHMTWSFYVVVRLSFSDMRIDGYEGGLVPKCWVQWHVQPRGTRKGMSALGHDLSR